MTGLRQFQERFLRDLWSQGEVESTLALGNQIGFSVYKNTVISACVDALKANYPTVYQLLGVDCFNDAATSFVRKCPPSSGILADYGQGFATFLASLDLVAELKYLPGVAALDRHWTEAHLAAAGPVLEATSLSGLTAEELSMSCFVLHPATRWHTFEAMPVYTIWRRHRDRLTLDADLEWKGESALITRPGSTVAWTAISHAAADFLSSCASRKRFDQAVEDASAAAVDDEPAWLSALILAGAFVRLELQP